VVSNEKCLYSLIIPGVKKEDLKHIIDVFLLNLSLNLQVEGFPIGVISKAIQEYKDIHFAKTASKKVLGSMNEIAFQAKYIIVNHYGALRMSRFLP
jgi:hypothetical protein